jgi:hypothetical protein
MTLCEGGVVITWRVFAPPVTVLTGYVMCPICPIIPAQITEFSLHGLTR